MSNYGVGSDLEKISAMTTWPVSSNVKQIHEFLGLTYFFRKFVKNYFAISQPLTNILKMDAFIWSDRAQVAF